jgi:hypothetical protein
VEWGGVVGIWYGMGWEWDMGWGCGINVNITQWP